MHCKSDPERWLLCLYLLAFAGLLALVATSPAGFRYDEAWFAQYVPLWHRLGFSREFLMALPGTTGPLHAFVQAMFEPLTALTPVGMRLVNVGLLVVVAGILHVASARNDVAGRMLTAGSVLVVPMTWVLAGLALTEMPALVMASLSLLLLRKGLQNSADQARVLRCWLASALCLGVAAWGRQPYALLAGVPVLVALTQARLRSAAAMYVAVVLTMVLPLLVIWGGLTPPSHQFVQQAPQFYNSLLSLGYAGFALALLLPALLWRHRVFLVVLLAATSVTNAVLSLWQQYPLLSAIEHWLPPQAVAVYGLLCGALFMTLAIATLVYIGQAIWQQRHDACQLATWLGLLCMCLWPALMPANFSSRYMAMGLPWLVLAVEPQRQGNLLTLAAAATGCAVGAVALLGYFNY